MNDNLYLHFINKRISYDIAFLGKPVASEGTVFVDGRHYELNGSFFKVAWLKAKFPEFKNRSEISFEELMGRLRELGAIHVAFSSKINVVGINSLIPLK